MKKIFLVFCLSFLICGVAKAANELGWVEYEPNSFINTNPKNLAINLGMKQITFLAKETGLSKTINNKPVNTIVNLTIADCSGIIKTKDVSRMYYNDDKLVFRVNLDKGTFWEYQSPDSKYYQNVQNFCSQYFKPVVIKKK